MRVSILPQLVHHLATLSVRGNFWLAISLTDYGLLARLSHPISQTIVIENTPDGSRSSAYSPSHRLTLTSTRRLHLDYSWRVFETPSPSHALPTSYLRLWVYLSSLSVPLLRYDDVSPCFNEIMCTSESSKSSVDEGVFMYRRRV
jgi:hypothetical protein